jgi:hypothetical protein
MPPKKTPPPERISSVNARERLLPTISWGIVELPVNPFSPEKRELVNTECKPYLEYGKRLLRPIEKLKSQIDQIDKKISDVIDLALTENITQLATIKYQTDLDTLTLKRLQKKEELLHLQDSLLEIDEEIKSILSKYEDRRTFVRRGGTRRRTRIKPKKTKKTNWSLKYNSNIKSGS